jgi:glucose/arabinose dehydrogenase
MLEIFDPNIRRLVAPIEGLHGIATQVRPIRTARRLFMARWNIARIIACAVLLIAFLPSIAFARATRPDDIALPEGVAVEVAVTGLAAPTMVAFDDQGGMLIAESGYGGAGDAQITRIEPDGKQTVLAPRSAFGDNLPVTAVAFHDSKVYIVHAGTVSTIETDGQLKSIITGLPGLGDHQANQIVFKDNLLYLNIGTMTNSAVVGTDNAVFGWLEQPQNRQLHDIPCEDLTLTNQLFSSENVLAADPPAVTTGAYAAFGTASNRVQGDVKCNGAIVRANLDGSDLQVVAWGFRNPYGLEIGPDGALYTTMHGFDACGSRPVENAWDCFYKVEEGAWYGWPDFACDIAVTDPQFKTNDKPQAQFLIANHPTESPPSPLAKFDPHASTNGFAFAPTADWGKPTDVFIALFGDLTPATGTVSEPQGVKIVRLDTTTGQISDFMSNKIAGEASKHNAGGFEHPSDVTFGPDGAMYITDWGVARISVEGLKLEPSSGVVWKVTRAAAGAGLPGGPTTLFALLGTVILAAGTVGLARGHAPRRYIVDGAWKGAIAGLVMGGCTMLIATAMLQLPWYAPARVFATMVMGRAALANILEFVLVPFLVGLVVLLVLTALLGACFAWLLRTHSPARAIGAGLLFGLTFWVLLQHFIGPLVFPLVSDKGFPPLWYAISFAIFGLVLGSLFALKRPKARTEIV